MKNLKTFEQFVNESLNEGISIKPNIYPSDDRDKKKTIREFAKKMNSINWDKELPGDTKPSGTVKARCGIHRNEDGSLKSVYFSGTMNKWEAVINWRFDNMSDRDNGALVYWKGSSGGGKDREFKQRFNATTTDDEIMDMSKDAIKELYNISTRK